MGESSNNKYIDLHLHSIYSEGSLTVTELIKLAKKNHFEVVSLTDHNTIAGTAEMLKIGHQAKIKIISGLELYTFYKDIYLHLLGYNFDYQNYFLTKELKDLKRQRIADVKIALKILIKQGFKINQDRLFKTKSDYVGFGQIISELYRFPRNIKKITKEMKNNEPNFFHIIQYYFGKKSQAYLPETCLPIQQAINLIHQAGGLAVLAHPAQQLGWNSQIVAELKKIGLDGLELLSPYHGWHDLEYWQKTAYNLNLLITGGSDFHSFVLEPAKAFIKEPWEYFKVPYSIFSQLKPWLNKYQK
jgi:3',5'-nucleoside bisphosphate phosphatase